MSLGARQGLAALLTAALAALHALPAAARDAAPGASCTQAEYPREAVRYELEGIALLLYRLAPDGRVADIRLSKSSGWALLDDAAYRALQACRFTPEQAARTKGAPQPMKYVWSLNGDAVLRPHLVPGSCPASDRFAGFEPYSDLPSGPHSVKVRLLVDAAGQPRGVKTEGARLPPAMADALVKYVESCRFGFDPALKGQRTDTAYGRVVLAK